MISYIKMGLPLHISDVNIDPDWAKKCDTMELSDLIRKLVESTIIFEQKKGRGQAELFPDIEWLQEGWGYEIPSRIAWFRGFRLRFKKSLTFGINLTRQTEKLCIIKAVPSHDFAYLKNRRYRMDYPAGLSFHDRYMRDHKLFDNVLVSLTQEVEKFLRSQKIITSFAEQKILKLD